MRSKQAANIRAWAVDRMISTTHDADNKENNLTTRITAFDEEARVFQYFCLPNYLILSTAETVDY